MAQAQSKAPRDRHPEIAAPILNLSLEAQIARAEQRVIDRDVRLRGNAARIVATIRSKRGEAMRWAAIGAGAFAIVGISFVGWRAWRGRAAARRDGEASAPPREAGPGFAAEIAAFAQTAVQWALRLHREQGVAGSLFGMARSAVWPQRAPSAAAAPPADRPDFADLP